MALDPTPVMREQLELIPDDDRVSLTCPACAHVHRFERHWLALRARDVIGCFGCGQHIEIPRLEGEVVRRKPSAAA